MLSGDEAEKSPKEEQPSNVVDSTIPIAQSPPAEDVSSGIVKEETNASADFEPITGNVEEAINCTNSDEVQEHHVENGTSHQVATNDNQESVTETQQPSSDQVNEETTNITENVHENKTTSSSQSKRKFRITGLYYPGDDMNHPDIVATMLASQSFHVWFEREPNKNQSRKKGGISFVFDDEVSAREAYFSIKDLTLNGAKLKFHIPKAFDDFLVQQQACELAATAEAPPEQDDPEKHQMIYVEQLVPNADQDLIYAIFGKDNLKNVEVKLDTRKSDGSKCAILTFHDREMAEQAQQEYDGFTVDDGDISRPMRILLYVDYLHRLSNERRRKTLGSTSTSRPTKPDISSGHEIENVHATRRAACEQKGKAGNLWSAQIVENRGEPVEIIKAKGRGDQEQAGKHARSWMPSAELPVIGEIHWNKIPVAEEIVEAVVAAPPPPPPPPPSEPEEQKTMDEHEHEPVQQRPPSRAVGEMNAHELSVLIEAAMVRGRVNWAELNTLEELWSLVHNASKDAGWQPELTLKEAMAVALDRAYRSVEADWQKDHLGSLIKIWKKELDVDSRSQVRIQLQLAESVPSPIQDNTATGSNGGGAGSALSNGGAGADYTPPPSEKRGKKRNKATKKALMHMMGVGALLADVKKEAAEQVEQGKPSKGKSNEQEKRKRKHSASESGEASTTTDEDGETSDWEEGTVSSSDNRRRGKQSEKRVPAKLPSKKKPESKAVEAAPTKPPTVPNADQMTNWMSTMMQSMGGGGSNIQQQWMTQAMPMMMQMMPMMAQMMQAQRMMAAATANVTQAQQQQQMQQMMMRMMQQMPQQMPGASVTSSQPSHAQPYQPPLPTASANPMAAWPQQQSGHRSATSAPQLPVQQPAYYGRHQQQQPPPPPTGPYGSHGSAYGGRSGDSYSLRGNYSR